MGMCFYLFVPRAGSSPAWGNGHVFLSFCASGGFEPRMGQWACVFIFLCLGRVRAPHGAMGMCFYLFVPRAGSSPAWGNEHVFLSFCASGGFEPRMGQWACVFIFLCLGRVRAPHGAMGMCFYLFVPRAGSSPA